MSVLCRRAEEARRQLLQEQDAEYQQVRPLSYRPRVIWKRPECRLLAWQILPAKG